MHFSNKKSQSALFWMGGKNNARLSHQSCVHYCDCLCMLKDWQLCAHLRCHGSLLWLCVVDRGVVGLVWRVWHRLWWHREQLVRHRWVWHPLKNNLAAVLYTYYQKRKTIGMKLCRHFIVQISGEFTELYELPQCLIPDSPPAS